MKSVRIRSFSCLYIFAFGLNTERYSVSFRIQSKCGKIGTRKLRIRALLHFYEMQKMVLLLDTSIVKSKTHSCFLYPCQSSRSERFLWLNADADTVFHPSISNQGWKGKAIYHNFIFSYMFQISCSSPSKYQNVIIFNKY